MAARRPEEAQKVDIRGQFKVDIRGQFTYFLVDTMSPKALNCSMAR